MDQAENIVGAFSEEQVERLTGVTAAQLRRWDRTDFFKPSFGLQDNRAPFSRVYSFKDLVSLRVLNQLRNVYSISMPELRKTAEALRHLGEGLWTSTTLYVHRKKVVFDEPETRRKREVTSAQYVADIPLEVAITDTRKAILALNVRSSEEEGQVIRARFVNHNAPVIAGTRIPVEAIKRFWEAGYNVEQIIGEYPDLTPRDVEAAVAYGGAGTVTAA